MKRSLDILVSVLGLLVSAPILLPAMFLVWWEDRHSPFYIAPRVGRGGKPFNLIKLRSMVINADKTGVDSTTANDPRITAVGKFIRRYKLDELPQFFNVLRGDMSVVGPRPNVKRDVDLYTVTEQKLLSVRPGITDLSSIVFSDENDILKGSTDPDLEYNQRIRPWKSRLGLLYIDASSVLLDLKLIVLTAIAIISRPSALKGIVNILNKLQAEPMLIEIASRQVSPKPYPPPGATGIVMSRA